MDWGLPVASPSAPSDSPAVWQEQRPDLSIRVACKELFLDFALTVPLDIPDISTHDDLVAAALQSLASAIASGTAQQAAKICEAPLHEVGEKSSLAKRQLPVHMLCSDCCILLKGHTPSTSIFSETVIAHDPPSNTDSSPAVWFDEHLVGTRGGDRQGVQHYHYVARGAAKPGERQGHFTSTLEKCNGLPEFPVRGAGWATGDEWVTVPPGGSGSPSVRPRESSRAGDFMNSLVTPRRPGELRGRKPRAGDAVVSPSGRTYHFTGTLQKRFRAPSLSAS